MSFEGFDVFFEGIERRGRERERERERDGNGAN